MISPGFAVGLSLVVSVSALSPPVASATCGRSAPQEVHPTGDEHGHGPDGTHAAHGHPGHQGHQHPANHLAGQTSPYLLQHLYNPVDWYPWGPEALARARREGKPIFLSIGYSACHWCHVMERETFENDELAALMNRWFVCIKVDREERPDLDEVYMNAVQMMTGRGGWPMSVFLTPDLTPFFGGTYFPPYDSGRSVGFKRVLEHAHTLWTDRREEVEQAGLNLVRKMRSESERRRGTQPVTLAVSETGFTTAQAHYDPQDGGFGSAPAFAPKFPHCTELVFLLRYAARTDSAEALSMVEHTLRTMAAGGIYDQVAGGFARYSTDRALTAPHFEKMLYDNSQLASLYMEAWQATGDAFYERIARETLDYVLREMTSPEGGFYSTTDADSEGEEGKFFVWSRAELREVCGEDADVAELYWGVSEQGNFEGHNILTARTVPAEVAVKTERSIEEVNRALSRARASLYVRRETRVHPLLDDKVLSSWNGLMLSAFARAAAVFDEGRYLEAARRNATFLLEKMRREDGRLFRTRRGGRSHLDGYLEDHAFVTAGLIDLFETDPDPKWIRTALELQAEVEAHFADPASGAWFSVADDGERLPVRTNSAQESSLPSDIGVAAMNAARLGLLAGDSATVERARDALASHAAELARYPVGYSQLLLVLEFLESRPPEIFVAGEAEDEAVGDYLRAARTQWPPHRVICALPPDGSSDLEELLPAAAGKRARDGIPAAFVCHEGLCEAPFLLHPREADGERGADASPGPTQKGAADERAEGAGAGEDDDPPGPEGAEAEPGSPGTQEPSSPSLFSLQGYDPLGPDFFPPAEPSASFSTAEAARQAGLLYWRNGAPPDPGPAPEGTLRVVLWGDELVADGRLAEALGGVFAGRTEQGDPSRPEMTVEVLARGERGYGADQAVLHMEEELAVLAPTVAVLVLNGHNDLGDSLRNRIFRTDKHNLLERNAWEMPDDEQDLLADSPPPATDESTGGEQKPSIAGLIAAHHAEHEAWSLGDNNVRPFLNDPWDADAACSGGSASVSAKQVLLDRIVGRAREKAGEAGVRLTACVVPSVIDLETERAEALGATLRKRYRPDRISETLTKTCLRNHLEVANLFGSLMVPADGGSGTEEETSTSLTGREASPWTDAGLRRAAEALADLLQPHLRAESR